MLDILFYLLLIVVLAAAVVVGGLFLRGYLSGGTAGGGLFKPRPEKRLDIVEQSNVDGRRRLVLIRRDDVEHLIMTGGPVDVVIETGIGERRAPARGEPGEAPAAVYARGPRVVGAASDT